MEKIARGMDRIKVPSPGEGQKYDSLLIMGTGNGQEEADRLKRLGLEDLEKRRPYTQIIAAGKDGPASDLPRAVKDHLLAERSMLSEETMSRLDSLQNARIDHLVAHSNGATVAETLIETISSQ